MPRRYRKGGEVIIGKREEKQDVGESDGKADGNPFSMAKAIPKKEEDSKPSKEDKDIDEKIIADIHKCLKDLRKPKVAKSKKKSSKLPDNIKVGGAILQL